MFTKTHQATDLYKMDVTKVSGNRESYSREKLCASLEGAGAPKGLVEKVCKTIEEEITPEVSTQYIFRAASRYLLKKNLSSAIRYNLKKGIMELGPAGFHFEHYVEAIVQSQGYITKRNVMMNGECATHEIDVIAQKEDEHFLMEMKFRNSQKVKTGIEVAMYAYARLLDITPVLKEREQRETPHAMWLVTNAKFTSNAITYGKCRKLKMTGWNYPKGRESLESIIKENTLYPVTVLPSVDHYALEQFAIHNIILAQDLLSYSPDALVSRFKIDQKCAEKIAHEVRALKKE